MYTKKKGPCSVEREKSIVFSDHTEIQAERNSSKSSVASTTGEGEKSSTHEAHDLP